MAGSPDELHLRKRPLKINTKTTPEEETATRATKWEDEPVSPAGRLFHQPTFNCHIISIFGFGMPVNVDTFIEGLEATLVRHPRFSSIPCTDYRIKTVRHVVRALYEPKTTLLKSLP